MKMTYTFSVSVLYICENVNKTNCIRTFMYVNKTFSNIVWKTNKENGRKVYHKFNIYKFVYVLYGYYKYIIDLLQVKIYNRDDQ